MRPAIGWLGFAIPSVLPVVVHAQDAKPAERRFVVQITEFRLPEAADPKLSSDELLKLYEKQRADGKAEVVEVLRLSALDGEEAMAQFGRRVAVTVGSVTAPARQPNAAPAVTRQVQHMMIGTMARVTVSSRDGQTTVDLVYESSRLESKGNDDVTPDTTSVQFKTRIAVTPGKPMLLGGTSAAGTACLMVLVE